MTAEAALAAQCEAPTHDAKELFSQMKISEKQEPPPKRFSLGDGFLGWQMHVLGDAKVSLGRNAYQSPSRPLRF